MAYQAPNTNGQATSANSAPVTVASDQLASGQTLATAALQGTGNASLATIATNTANVPTIGQKTSSGSQPVVVASDQSTIPVKLQNNIAATTGSIATSSTTIVTGPLSGVGSATIQFAGTFAGVNATFEGSIDNANWIAIPAIPLGAVNPAAVTSTGVISTVSVYNIAPILGIQYLRVRTTAWTSGTANVTIQPSAQFYGYNVNAVVTSAPTTTVTGTIAATESGTWTVQPGNTQNTTPWLTREGPANTATLTQVTPSTTSTVIKNANTSRKAIVIYNASSSDCYIAYASTSSSTAYTIYLPSLGTTTIRGEEYAGIISGLWLSATGNNMQVTEIV